MAKRLIRAGAAILLVILVIVVPGISQQTALAVNASISSVPSVSSVAPGGTFDVAIKIATDTATRGGQFVLSWDPAKAQCTSVTRGTYFQVFADANGGSVYYTPGTPLIDNSAGQFPKSVSTVVDTICTQSLTDATGPNNTYLGVTGSGDMYVLHMTATAGASGTIVFTLSHTKLVDSVFVNGVFGTIASTTNNGQITISGGGSNPPAVSSSAASAITSSGATLNGSLSALGSGSSASVSFDYGTTTSYGASTTAQTLTAAGSFTSALTGLTANTLYHFRAKAVGSSTVYSSDLTFTTATAGALAVTSSAASNITTTGATLNGSLSSLGSDSSASVSFDYGTTTSYGASTTAQTLTAAGSFTSALTGLTANTLYHFRAKAVGSSTVYSSDLTFTTATAGALAVTSSAASSITTTGATLNGSLSSLGSDSSASLSFDYGTTTSYGASTTAQTLTAAGSFTSALTGLTANTLYHFRAKAVGSSTVYSSDLTFTTATAGALAVTSSAASNITTTGATLNGSLSSLGSDSSASVSFDYGTTTSYGASTTAQTLTAAGSFTSALTGLTVNTLYHFRAKAVGSSTVYSSDLTFTTAQAAVLAVSTNPASTVGTNSATLNGSLSSLGSDSSAAVSFEYGTTTSYGASTTAATLSAAGSFNASIGGLSAGTLYHFRAKAAGSTTVYGNDVTFSTANPDSTPVPTPTPTPTPMPTTAPTTATQASTVTITAAPRTSATSPKPTSKAVSTAQRSTTTLDLSDSIDTSGMLQSDFQQGGIRYSGNNQIVSLDIKTGVRVVASDGTPVEAITAMPGTNVPAAPTNVNIVSAVDFGPSGSVFSSPIQVVFGYDPTLVPQNIDANALSLRFFDPDTLKWVKCDYIVDTQNRQITGYISHFSLYAVMAEVSTGFMGMGWNWSGIIIAVEVLAGALVIYYFLRRRKPLVPAAAAAHPAATVVAAEVVQPVARVAAAEVQEAKRAEIREPVREVKETTRVVWDDILTGNQKKGEPFKTHLEIVGGKIIIPRDGKSADIELINAPDSRIMISLQYDPELHPQGLAKIMVLGSASEYEKSKEIQK